MTHPVEHGDPLQSGRNKSILAFLHLNTFHTFSPDPVSSTAMLALTTQLKTMADFDPPVLIIGAGISGLVLAQYLQHLGVRFEIFDRDSALDARTGGWGLTLHWALPTLRDLLPAHIVDQFSNAFVNKDASSRGDVGSFQFFNLKSGEAMYSVPAKERIRVNRGRLRELLTSGVDVHVSCLRHDILELQCSC